MNQLFTYEKQIADKVQLAPVPDMQDAVWSRIEAMLDADISPEQTEITKQLVKTNEKLFSKKRITIAVIILAVLLSIFISKQNTNSHQKKVKPDNSIPVNPSVPVNSSQIVPIQTESPITKRTFKKMNPINDSGKTAFDSVFIKPTLNDKNPPLENAELPTMGNPSTQELQKKDSLIKKPRGVRGISDSDYKFVMPKKDSL